MASAGFEPTNSGSSGQYANQIAAVDNTIYKIKMFHLKLI
jgi:hypothetical protein